MTSKRKSSSASKTVSWSESEETPRNPEVSKKPKAILPKDEVIEEDSDPLSVSSEDEGFRPPDNSKKFAVESSDNSSEVSDVKEEERCRPLKELKQRPPLRKQSSRLYGGLCYHYII